jgi:hydroxymethylbilane synthase
MLKIGTRGSPLAIRQADGAGSGLVQPYQLVQIKSQGDIDQKTPIHEMGGKHIFCSAIEEKLLSKEIDCAIHSAKDMATEVTEGTEVLGCVWNVGDRRDALVGPFENFDSIPRGYRIGTSAPRRAKMLADQREDLRFVPIRGNIQTRLDLINNQEVDGIIMAKCAIDRLGIQVQHAPMPETELLPAAGQGKVVVQVRSDDVKMKDIWNPQILEWPTIELMAERYVLELVGGDCHTAIGVTADARPEKGMIQIRCSYHDGTKAYHIQEIGELSEYKTIAEKVVSQFLSQ